MTITPPSRMARRIIIRRSTASEDSAEADPDPAPAYRIRIYERGVIAGIVFAAGLVCLAFVHWLLGLVLLIAGPIIQRRHHICGSCGNTVASTSALCPTCRAGLIESPDTTRAIIHLLIATLLLAFAIAWWLL